MVNCNNKRFRYLAPSSLNSLSSLTDGLDDRQNNHKLVSKPLTPAHTNQSPTCPSFESCWNVLMCFDNCQNISNMPIYRRHHHSLHIGLIT